MKKKTVSPKLTPLMAAALRWAGTMPLSWNYGRQRFEAANKGVGIIFSFRTVEALRGHGLVQVSFRTERQPGKRERLYFLDKAYITRTGRARLRRA